MINVEFTREDAKEELDYIVLPKKILGYSQMNEKDFKHIYGLEKNECDKLYDFCVSICREKYLSWENAIDEFVSISNINKYVNKGTKDNKGKVPPNMPKKKYLPLIIRQVLYWIYIYFNMTSNKISAPKVLEYMKGKGISLSHNFFSEQDKSANDYLNLVTFKTPEFLINYMGQKKDENGTAHAIRHLAHQAGEYDMFIDCFGGSGAASMSINHHKNTCYIYNELDSIVYKLFKTLVNEDGHRKLIDKLNLVQDIIVGYNFIREGEKIKIDLHEDLCRYIDLSSFYGKRYNKGVEGIVELFIEKHSNSDRNSIEDIYDKDIIKEWDFCFDDQFDMIKDILQVTIIEDNKNYIGDEVIRSGKLYRCLNRINNKKSYILRRAIIELFPENIQCDLNKIKKKNDFNIYVDKLSDEKKKEFCNIFDIKNVFFIFLLVKEKAELYMYNICLTCEKRKMLLSDYIMKSQFYKLIALYEYVMHVYNELNKGVNILKNDEDIACLYVLYMYSEGNIARKGAVNKIYENTKEEIYKKDFDKVITNIHKIIKNTHCENMSAIKSINDSYLLDKYKIGKSTDILKKKKSNENNNIIKSMLLYCDSPYEATDGYNINEKEAFNIKQLIADLAETNGKFIFSCRARYGGKKNSIENTANIWKNVMLEFLDMYYEFEEVNGHNIAHAKRQKKIVNNEGGVIDSKQYYKLKVE